MDANATALLHKNAVPTTDDSSKYTWFQVSSFIRLSRCCLTGVYGTLGVSPGVGLTFFLFRGGGVEGFFILWFSVLGQILQLRI